MSGIKLGRPTGHGKSKLDQFRPEIEALLLSGSSQKYCRPLPNHRSYLIELDQKEWYQEVSKSSVTAPYYY